MSKTIKFFVITVICFIASGICAYNADSYFPDWVTMGVWLRYMSILFGIFGAINFICVLSYLEKR